MNELFQRICDKDPSQRNVTELIEIVIRSNSFELDQAAGKLAGNERHKICIVIADTVRGRGTISNLELGALLSVFLLVTSDRDRASQFKDMEEETGIKRTQLYRLIGMFEGFGRDLIPHPDVAARCTCEALKLLSGESVPEAARLEAIEIARSGQLVTIKVAQSLRKKHAVDIRQRQCDVPAQPAATNERPDATVDTRHTNAPGANVLWQFSDPKLRVLVEHKPGSGAVNGEAIVFALEAALTRARSEYPIDDSVSQPQLA